jgi:hypothetical protein
MAFDHEKLDVYRLAVLFSSWVGEWLEGSLSMIESQPSHPDHGTKVSTSTMTIASPSPSPSTSTSTSAALPKRGR